jgi:transcriptional regulator with XRE-family HTH domain
MIENSRIKGREMNEAERRRALADFLRTRRARLKPTDVGLPARNRRRTPGLRREEVAELANIGVSWYTLLEQGQDVHPSRQVLVSLARALKLTAAEERHLFRLSNPDEQQAQMVEAEEQVPPALQRIIDALNPHPAFVIGQRWDALSWNHAADLLFHFHEPCPPHSHNVVWRFFQHGARMFDQNWEMQAQNLVAQFRADYARFPGNPAFREIIEDLQRVSPQFSLWWAQQEVRGLPDGPRTMQHPTLGALEFDHVTFQAFTTPGLRVKVYSARPATACKLEEVLCTLSHDENQ